MIVELPEKAINEAKREMIALHERCLTQYLISLDVRYSIRRKFFIIYHSAINEDNVQEYFHLPLKVFVPALIRDELDKVKSFNNYSRKGDRHSNRKGKNIRYV